MGLTLDERYDILTGHWMERIVPAFREDNLTINDVYASGVVWTKASAGLYMFVRNGATDAVIATVEVDNEGVVRAHTHAPEVGDPIVDQLVTVILRAETEPCTHLTR